jgi:DNA-binding winged helix-turn-helix (wHTH) protein
VSSPRIVSGSTLTSRINAARKAIGDTGEEQRLIRTAMRKGLRFVGLVDEAGRTASGPGGQLTQPPRIRLSACSNRAAITRLLRGA